METQIFNIGRKEIKYKVVENGCWECFSHAVDANGYPVAIVNHLWDRIYRHVFRLFKGSIPNECVIRHACDNRLCINPEHLLIGTHKDNVSDRVNRGRSAKGEDNGRSKLTESEVLAILKDTVTPKMKLAKKYNVDAKTIRDIKNGITWKSVTGL